MDLKKVNLLQVNVAVLMWGVTAMFAKGIKLPAEHITMYRSAVMAICLFILILAMRIPLKLKDPKHYFVMFILGLLLCLHWVTYFRALKMSTAAIAILSLHIYPVITALIEPFVFKEKLHYQDVIVALLVLLGIYIMTPEMSLDNEITQGIVFGIISGSLFACRNLITRKYVQSYDSYTLMFWQGAVTAILLLPLIFYMEPVEYSGQTIIGLIILGAIFTCIPHTLYSASLKSLSAKTVSIFSAILPIYGAFFGFLIHDEKVSVNIFIGGLIMHLFAGD